MISRTVLSTLSMMSFMLSIISEDAEDGKSAKQNTLGFQSLFLLARLDRILTREDHHEANHDEEDKQGNGLAVHAPIITPSPENARPTPRKLKRNFGLASILSNFGVPARYGKNRGFGTPVPPPIPPYTRSV